MELTIWTSWSSREIGPESGSLTSLDWTWTRSEGLGGYILRGKKWAWSLITSFFHNNFSTFWKEKKRQCKEFSFWPKHFTGSYYFLKAKSTNKPTIPRKWNSLINRHKQLPPNALIYVLVYSEKKHFYNLKKEFNNNCIIQSIIQLTDP